MSFATTWLTTTQAAEHADRARQHLSAGAARIQPATIRQWVARGHLTAGGMDARGRRLYRLADVAQAERDTRGRALRLVGIGAR